MGIKIHYTLITEDYQTVLVSIKLTEELAGKASYNVEEIDEEVYIDYSLLSLPTSMRDVEDTKKYLMGRWRGLAEYPMRDVPEEPPWTWIAIDYPRIGWYTYAYPWILSRTGRETRLQGIMVDCGMAEQFKMAFYKNGRYYICDGFTETHAFTIDEVEPNTLYHKWICRLLEKLEKDGRWWNFYVSDEAEYYYTLDESRIVKSFQELNRLIYSFAVQLDKAIEEGGLDMNVVAGGRVDFRGMREKFEEVEEPYPEKQTTLDKFGGEEDE